jgi:hypothetical protein
MDETLGQFERIQGSSHHLKSRAFSVQLSQKNTASRFGFGGHCWQDLVSSYKWQRHYASSHQQRVPRGSLLDGSAPQRLQEIWDNSGSERRRSMTQRWVY